MRFRPHEQTVLALSDGLWKGVTESRLEQGARAARRFDVPVSEDVGLDDAIGQVLDLALTGAERLACV
ncbi:MAG: hypothetical protein EXQ81_05040 [Thermoleophilia bacterium]|nr:hypothetical protein [Thermoleophilia bacterium]